MRTSVILLLFIAGTLLEPGLSVTVCGIFSYISPIFQGAFTNLKYLLYTHHNPYEPCDLQPTEEALKECKFNHKHDTKIIIHGWVPQIATAIGNDFRLKDNLLKAGDFNVIIINWTAYFVPYNYTKYIPINYELAAIVGVALGFKISAYIQYLQLHANADPKTFHMYGHSMGAALASVAAKLTCGIGRITYLDASAPLYRYLPQFLHPHYDDAEYVEEIHSSDAYTVLGGYGFIRPIAQIDFYPNGGYSQPNCYGGATFSHEIGVNITAEGKQGLITCNHEASYNFYLASFIDGCKFLGRICDSWENYNYGDCSNNTICRMGYYSEKIPDLPVQSQCFMRTAAKYPYCLELVE